MTRPPRKIRQSRVFKSKLFENKCMGGSPRYARIRRLIPAMCRNAARGVIEQKHAASMLINGQVVSSGINSIRGARPCHAEMDAVRSFLVARGMIGYVKECRFLRGSQCPEREKGPT